MKTTYLQITFTQITKELYWEMLECVPPEIMKNGAFLVGEPYDHCALGIPRFSGYFTRNETYWVSDQVMTRREFCTFKVMPSPQLPAFTIETWRQ